TMTLLDNTTEGGRQFYAWYLVNPPTGSNTLSGTNGSSANWHDIAYDTFSNTATTSPIDCHSSASNTAGGSNPSCTTTTSSVLGWSACFGPSQNDSTLLASGPGWTLGGNPNDGNALNNYVANSTMAASTSLSVTCTRVDDTMAIIAGI